MSISGLPMLSVLRATTRLQQLTGVKLNRHTFFSLLSKIERCFERKPVFLRSDNEMTLGTAFNAEVNRRGITREISATHTSQWNGHAERAGKTIIEKARALHVSARLPDNLWPETVNAAVCLMIRTPMERIGWKTPFELVHSKKPSIEHLGIYGCKAYALNKLLPRKEKLQERVLVGYLVGYESTNIYRIWSPASKRIIRSRDVTFDEDSRYSQDANETYGELSEAEDELEEAPTTVRPRIWLSNSDTEESDSDVEEETAVEDTPPSSPDPAGPEDSVTQLPTPTASDILCGSPQEYPTDSPAAESSRGESEGPSQRDPEPPRRRLGRLMPAQYETEPLLTAEEGNRAPRADEVTLSVNIHNIVKDRRTRRRHNAYVAQINGQATSNTAFLAAFAAAFRTQEPTPRVHQDQLPPEPRNYQELLTHQYKDQSIEALQEELKKIQGKGVWKEVQQSVGEQSKK